MIRDMLRELDARRVRHVVVGGVAGRAHGSPRVTEDLDICYATDPANVRTLAGLLRAWNARLRVGEGTADEGLELPFTVDERALAEIPLLTLQTDRGRIDVMHEVPGVGDYAACRVRSEVFEAGGLRFAALSLDALIDAKRATGREKDRLHVLELEALRSMKREQRVLQAPDGAPPAGTPAPSLPSDIALYERIQGLHVQRIRLGGDPAREEAIRKQLAELPPLWEVAGRIVAASRDPEALRDLSPAQLATVRAARETLSRSGHSRERGWER